MSHKENLKPIQNQYNTKEFLAQQTDALCENSVIYTTMLS